jgi:hypothetical protein
VKYFAYKSNDVGAGQAELMGHRRNAYKRIVSKPKNMGLLGRVQCAWKDKTTIDVEQNGLIAESDGGLLYEGQLISFHKPDRISI